MTDIRIIGKNMEDSDGKRIFMLVCDIELEMYMIYYKLESALEKISKTSQIGNRTHLNRTDTFITLPLTKSDDIVSYF